ncbi:anaphase promoting complex, subunit 10-like protein [Trypanosoma cruzi]|uniref:Anaphase-promoting complex subunit 10 n=2 Tax=Trypanosoma cruzi TaxID=5693 RepID=Q4CW58_TRYCC|nr:anaphase promoting complex subunit 10, putative [Trypanosoma cruzi]EAN84510.1 anaphase promoting complex subunit 10, putative [Trypanosoma cruzi]PWV17349.1 anaphase promoting complex, subunit 10-like protein [Trypanosoma cruzi]RNC48393.1 anaphase promoting complex subunit 10 [Trypanosoma cruzi]|eukprot:XP_806361.1 anaphase promoting complex subunit 10 [Trypanosoma cruzi strain CL Brener]
MEPPPREGQEGDNDQNAYSVYSESPSIINDEEILTREKLGALITLHDAVWTVSSAKHGNGVTCLLDGSHSTFWQSDGVLPHVISIDYARLTPVSVVALYLDFQQDESYTPRRIRVQSGTHSGDMADVAAVTVDDPRGWVFIRMNLEVETSEPWELEIMRGTEGGGAGTHALGASRARETAEGISSSPPFFPQDAIVENDDYAEFMGDGVWCTHIRIILEENRQNGRDCHVRGVRVLGPMRQSVFTTASFSQHLLLR